MVKRRFTNWGVPGGISSKSRTNIMPEWAKKEIEWSCKMGKSSEDDNKVFQWLEDHKGINAGALKGAEGLIYSVGNNWVHYYVDRRKRYREVREGDFFVVFQGDDNEFTFMSDGQFRLLLDKIRIRHIDENQG